jgi:[ribosomal protein S5]-alanine N-acetyltransferase
MTQPLTRIPLGDGIELRRLTLADAEDIARYANNRHVWRNLRDLFPHPYHREHAEGFIRMLETGDGETAFAIANEREAIGVIGFHREPDVHRRCAEVGYWLGEPFWGGGIVSRALVAVCDHIFQNYDFVRLTAPVFAWNPASARVLEKAGFIREGVMRKAVFKDGEFTDLLIYGRVR